MGSKGNGTKDTDRVDSWRDVSFDDLGKLERLASVTTREKYEKKPECVGEEDGKIS